MRIALLIYFAWLFAWFLPAHTRGRITLEPSSGSLGKPSCCASDDGARKASPTGPRQPSDRDRRNCAVCHWAAGVLPVVPVVFSLDYLENAFCRWVPFVSQPRRAFIGFHHLPRGPPPEPS